jgi:putative ABC transport system substrate-binding protein
MLRWNITRTSSGGLLFPTDSFINVHQEMILEVAAQYRLPTIFSEEQGVRKGGLLFYGIQLLNQFQQAAIYADRILKGTKPGDLPVQMPTNFKLIINMKTVRSLAIDVPMGLMLRADDMIE